MCVVWCGVVWCGVVWCGVVWCGVVLCCVVLCCVFLVCIVCIVCCGVFLLCVVCVMSCVSCVCFRGSTLRGSHPSRPCLTCLTTPGDHLVPDPLPQTPGGEVWCQTSPWCHPSPSPDPKIRPFFPLLPPKIPCVFPLWWFFSWNFGGVCRFSKVSGL